MQTRKRIVTAAAGEFRKHGIVATGLNDLMKAAGLTHGGFYKHFESKDQLVSEACAEAVEALIERVSAAGSGAAATYLSTRHRDNRADGMPTFRDRERAWPKRRKDTSRCDGWIPEARRDHGRSVRQDPARSRETVRPGGGLDDDRCADDVAYRDRPRPVGRDSSVGREEHDRQMSGRSARMFRRRFQGVPGVRPSFKLT